MNAWTPYKKRVSQLAANGFIDKKGNQAYINTYESI